MLPYQIVQLLRNPEVPNGVIADAIQDFCEGGKVATVYAVVGQRGEYSDWKTWTVAAFLDGRKAAEFRSQLQEEADKIQKLYDEWGDSNNWETTDRKAEEFQKTDPGYGISGYETRYDVVEIPLRG